MKIPLPPPPSGPDDEEVRAANRARSAKHRAALKLRADVDGALVDALVKVSVREGERGAKAGSLTMEAVITAAWEKLVKDGYGRKAAGALIQSRLDVNAPRVEPAMPASGPCETQGDAVH